jgi:hypothetical protein
MMAFSELQRHEQLMHERQIRLGCLQLAAQGREGWNPKEIANAAAILTEFALEGRSGRSGGTEAMNESDAEGSIEAVLDEAGADVRA